MNTKKVILITSGSVITVAVGLIVIGKIHRKNILNKLDLILNADTGSAANTQITTQAADPNMYKDNQKEVTIDAATGDGIITNIYEDYHYLIPNNSSDVMVQINKLNSKADFSYISSLWGKKYGSPTLFNFLKDHFGDIINEIESYISGLK